MSFNPFDDANFTGGLVQPTVASPKKASLAAKARRQREMHARQRQQQNDSRLKPVTDESASSLTSSSGQPMGAGLDLSFFDTPQKKQNKTLSKAFTFSDMHTNINFDEDDFKGTDSSNDTDSSEADSWDGFEPQLKAKNSKLSPRVLALARKSSMRRKMQEVKVHQPNFDSQPPPPPYPPLAKNKHQPPPPSTAPPPTALGSVSSHARHTLSTDAAGDEAKTGKLKQILRQITQYTGRKSSSGAHSLLLAYEELALFIQNPQYRDSATAVDGLLEVYSAIKQLEHDFGTMDARLVNAYESLKKLAVQLGAQQAEIFNRAERICIQIRQQSGPVTIAAANVERPDTPKKGHFESVEHKYGLSSENVKQMLDPFLNNVSASIAKFYPGQLSGVLLLRRGKLMKKWISAYFCLTNGRLAVYRSHTAVGEGDSLVDVRLHGKMRLSGYKTYPQKGRPPVMAIKLQELDQTLGLSGPQGAKWETLFKFGAIKGSIFELWKTAVNATITFHRKKDPTLALKKTFSFGLA